MNFKRLFGVALRWSWLVILGGLIAGATAYIIGVNTTPIYEANAKLLIDKAPDGGSGNSEYSALLIEQRLTERYIELIKIQPVLVQALEQLNIEPSLSSINALKKKISVNSASNSVILTISIKDTNPKRTIDIANALGSAFQSYITNLEHARYAEPLKNWENLMLKLADDINAIEAQIAAVDASTSPGDASRLQTQLNELQITYTQAFNELESLRVKQARESSNVLMIEEAQTSVQISPRIFSNTIIAAFLGALFAISIIMIAEFLDDRLRSPEEVAKNYGKSVLGTIGYIKGDQPGERLISYIAPRDPISEAYRILRTNLSFANIDETLKKIIVTSSLPGEGKSTTTANLAIVIAQSGKKVVLIDSDLRRPTQHKIFNLSNDQGLIMALMDSVTPVTEHLQPALVPGLHIMTSGPIPPNPAELLNSKRMSQLLEDLSQQFDFVILDTPPLQIVADASILASQVDGCILVAAIGSTQQKSLKRSCDILNQNKANLLGFVVNRLQAMSVTDYDYYYSDYQYYTYEYNKRTDTKKGGKKGFLPSWLTGLVKR